MIWESTDHGFVSRPLFFARRCAQSIYSLWSSFGHGFILGTGWGGGWDADSPFMVPWGKMKGT